MDLSKRMKRFVHRAGILVLMSKLCRQLLLVTRLSDTIKILLSDTNYILFLDKIKILLSDTIKNILSDTIKIILSVTIKIILLDTIKMILSKSKSNLNPDQQHPHNSILQKNAYSKSRLIQLETEMSKCFLDNLVQKPLFPHLKLSLDLLRTFIISVIVMKCFK